MAVPREIPPLPVGPVDLKLPVRRLWPQQDFVRADWGLPTDVNKPPIFAKPNKTAMLGPTCGKRGGGNLN